MRRFGLEIECRVYNANNVVSALEAAGIRSQAVGHGAENYNVWQVQPDGSIDGLEIVSPRLTSLDDVKTVCEVLQSIGAEIPRNSTAYGLHVHLDATDLTMQQVCAIGLRYAQAEDEIMAMLPRSRRSNRFCNPINDTCKEILRVGASGQSLSLSQQRTLFGGEHANTHYDGARYRTVNMMRYLRARNSANRTIEFRAHSGTIEFAKISHWVLLLQKLAEQALAKVAAGTNAVAVPTPATGRVRRGRRAGESRVVRDNTKVLQFIEQAKTPGGATVEWCQINLGWTKDNVQSWAAYVRAWGFPLVPVTAPRLPGQAGRARVVAYRMEAAAVVMQTAAAVLTPAKVAELLGGGLKADLPAELVEYIDNRTQAMRERDERRAARLAR
jgi:hypothetical protein